MSTLRIFLFGYVQITHDDWPSEVKVPPGARALLSYLLLERHRLLPRQTLANLFWSDYSEGRARSCLNTTLWRLRRALESEGIPRETYLLTNHRDEIGFNWDCDHWLDAAVFEEKVSEILGKNIREVDTTEARQLEKALQLHSADLLEGFYDDWALRERERLRQLYLDGLVYLMHYYKHQKAYEQCLACGQQILRHDPLRESIHREMMRFYWESGRPAMATRQYQACHELLATELNLVPMEETQTLHAQIISVPDYPKLSTKVVTGETPSLQQALHQLQQAILELKKTQEKLEQATQLVKDLQNTSSTRAQ